jgi:hypothetical protein
LGDEEVTVQRAADSIRVAASGGRNLDRGGLPQGGDQRGVVLRLAQEVWQASAVGDEAAEQLEEENQRLKKLVADLSLDKEMLQDVIRRKI